MDALRLAAVERILDALLDIFGADWFVEQLGEEYEQELAELGLMDASTVSGSSAEEGSVEEGSVDEPSSEESQEKPKPQDDNAMDEE